MKYNDEQIQKTINELLKQALEAQQFAIKDLKIRASLTEDSSVLNISHSAYIKLQASIDSIKADLAKPKPEILCASCKAIGAAYNIGKESPQQKPLTPQEVWALMPWNYDMSSCPKNNIFLQLANGYVGEGLGLTSGDGHYMTAAQERVTNAIAWLPLPEIK